MNKTIFITGASKGIGRKIAKLFIEKGWNVVATMRSPEKETEFTQIPNVLVTELDVLKPETIQKSIQLATEKFGKIEVLVNNAAYGQFGLLETVKLKQIERQAHLTKTKEDGIEYMKEIYVASNCTILGDILKIV